MEKYITRFAPSPTGNLHLGHAFSALFAYEHALKSNGTFILRIEDIDQQRCKKEFINRIYEDLKWLGIKWHDTPRIQSEHFSEYKKTLSMLEEMGLIYPCFCTRKEITEEIRRSGHAPHLGEEYIYPQTCKKLSRAEAEKKKKQGIPFALRLDMSTAQELVIKKHGTIVWRDLNFGSFIATPSMFGDIVIARKDVPASYHLAVVHDDNLQGVNLVTRGEDLMTATHIHRLLQALLGFSVPTYCHHHNLKDETGKKLSKRNQGITITELRAKGVTPNQIIDKILQFR